MSVITAERFNTLKANIIEECKRRSTILSDGKLDNKYILDESYFTAEVSSKVINEYIEKLNKPLTVINNKDFTEMSFEGRTIKEEDIKKLEDGIKSLAQKNAEKGSETGCASSCTGLCNNGCYSTCSGWCSRQCFGCGSTCIGGCSGCSNTCIGGCKDDCVSSCATNCYSSCSGGCESGCYGCAGSCKGTCDGCSNMCTGCYSKCTSTATYDYRD